MPRRKLPPRLYFDAGRGRWIMRYGSWMRRTPFGLNEKVAAQESMDRLVGRKAWFSAAIRKPAKRPQPEPQWARSKLVGVVYLISAEGGGEYPIKIGFSASTGMEKRLSELQVGSPVRLAVIATHEATFAQEQAIHERLSSHRVSGEWFRRGPAVDLLMAELIAGRLTEWLADSPYLAETVPCAENVQ